jgi:hypothetical protein
MAKGIKIDRSVFQVEGLGETLRLMNNWPKEAKKELRAEVQQMTGKHAAYIAANAARNTDSRVRGQAPTVRAKKDRLPTVLIGGARQVKVSRPGANPTAGQVLFGTEFGARPGPNAWRFPPAADSYWLFASLKGRQPALLSEWEAAITKVARKWAD